MSKDKTSYCKLEGEPIVIHSKTLRIRIDEPTFEYRLLRKKDGTFCVQRAYIKYKDIWGTEREIVWKDVETVWEE